MTASEKILFGITDEAKTKAAEITAEAEEKARTLIDEAKAEAEKEADSIKAEAEKKARLIRQTGESSAALVKRDAALKCKRELIDKALSFVTDTVNGFDDKKYFDFLLTIINREKLSENGLIMLCENDLKRDTADFKESVKKMNLTLSKDPADINGGFILKYGDILINGEISALVHEKRDELIDAVNKELFK